MKKRYNIMLNPATLARVDAYAEDNDLSRSQLIDKVLYDFCNDVGARAVPDEDIKDQMRCDDEESYLYSDCYISFD